VQAPLVEDIDAISIGGFTILQPHPRLWFGDGGTGKSTLGLYFAGELEWRAFQRCASIGSSTSSTIVGSSKSCSVQTCPTGNIGGATAR
jgi:hypothetical protein